MERRRGMGTERKGREEIKGNGYKKTHKGGGSKGEAFPCFCPWFEIHGFHRPNRVVDDRDSKTIDSITESNKAEFE